MDTVIPHNPLLSTESAIRFDPIADYSGQVATVWDLGGQPASYSGKEYSRLFKEIMGALT